MKTLIDKEPETLDIDEKIIEDIQYTTDQIAQIYDLKDSEVSITLTDNKNIHEMNKKYRNIDRPTDVLSFALNEGDEPIIKGGPAINVLGDIVISVEKAAEQAEEYGHGIRREIAFLVTHGMLHLLGYDHIKEEDRIKMRKEEDFVMEKIGILR